MKRLLVIILTFATVLATVSCGGKGSKNCSHTSYTDGVCDGCGKVCVHEYSNGVCKTCKDVCEHSDYQNGECTACGEDCKHSFENGVCGQCGNEDPEFIPADGGESLYDDLVDEFKYLILYKYTYTELPTRGDNETEFTDVLYDVCAHYDPSSEMGYAYKDVNSDGWKELVIIGRDKRLFALFSIVDKKPTVVETFSNGLGYLAPDGMIFYTVKELSGEVQILLEYHMEYLAEGKLEGFVYGRRDGDGDPLTDDDVFFKVENGDEEALTYEDYGYYQDKYEYYWSYSTRLSSRSGLRFNTALIAQNTASNTADFTSYEGVKNTFGLMYTDVAGGKYERSKWTSGKYDDGLKFNSDGDWYTYNAILGAVVTVQNSSTAKFGSAEKDLNGDGINELILMDDKQNIFAIFTLNGGTPVLLDTFSDVRYACIDENGDIFVAKRTMPGMPKDFEFSIYEIKDGELSRKIEICCKYESNETNAEQNAWEKDGVQITKTEYDEIYGLYFSDKAEKASVANYATYTRENAGLNFVEIN